MNIWKFFVAAFIAQAGLAKAEEQQDKPLDLQPTGNNATNVTETPANPFILFTPDTKRNLRAADKPVSSKEFPKITGLTAQSVQFDASALNAIQQQGATETFVQLAANAQPMKVKSRAVHKIGGKDKKSGNLRGRTLDDAEELQTDEYKTIHMESDDGSSYAHCAIYPDGKRLICVQYTHNGVQNTTMLMVDPNEDGSHSLTMISPEQQRQQFVGMQPETPVRVEQANTGRTLQDSQAQPDRTRRTTAGKQTRTLAVALANDVVQSFGGLANAKARMAVEVSLLNQVLSNSKVNLVVQLSDVYISSVGSTGDSYIDLMNARDQIRANEPLAQKADMLTFLVNNGGSRGFLYSYKPDSEASLKKQTISVVSMQMLGGKSFQHEFGHNIGGQHQPEYAYASSRFPNAYAFASADQWQGTVLAYVNSSPDRFPIYSSATGYYAGVKVGSPTINNADTMNFVLDEMADLFGNANYPSNPQTTPPTPQPTPMPTVGVYTAKPTVKLTAKPTPKATAHPTVKGTQPPTNKVTTRAPTKAATTRAPTKKATPAPTKPKTHAPTKKGTAKPTAKATNAPTIDQSPFLQLNKFVDVKYQLDANSPKIPPLNIQIGKTRKVVIGPNGIKILNSDGSNVKPVYFILDDNVRSKISFLPGATNNFRIINTGTDVNLYFIPMVRKVVKKKNAKRVIYVEGPPQLLVALHKATKNDPSTIDANVQISFPGVPGDYYDVGTVQNVATKHTPKGRMLSAEEAANQPTVIVNYINFSKAPEEETAKLLSVEFEPALKIIASSPENILRLLDDATFSLGEKEANKLFGSGFMQKLFENASEKTIKNTFRQLHHYHKSELIQYVKPEVIKNHQVLIASQAMRAAMVEDEKAQPKHKQSGPS